MLSNWGGGGESAQSKIRGGGQTMGDTMPRQFNDNLIAIIFNYLIKFLQI